MILLDNMFLKHLLYILDYHVYLQNSLYTIDLLLLKTTLFVVIALEQLQMFQNLFLLPDKHQVS